MNVPRKAPEFDDVLRRAREARAARDAAQQDWVAARDALRAATDVATLPRGLRDEVQTLLHEDDEHHAHRRWRPSPS